VRDPHTKNAEYGILYGHGPNIFDGIIQMLTFIELNVPKWNVVCFVSLAEAINV
jgi:hypothetical protein